MTPEARARLVEVMARGVFLARKNAACLCSRHRGECRAPYDVVRDAGHVDQAHAAIDAAERAGFKWEERK